MSEELKPCPCCGSKAIISISDFIPYQIVCENPNCQLQGRVSGDIRKAVNAWNTRHIPEGYKLVSAEYLHTAIVHSNRLINDPDIDVSVNFEFAIEQLEAAE